MAMRLQSQSCVARHQERNVETRKHSSSALEWQRKVILRLVVVKLCAVMKSTAAARQGVAQNAAVVYNIDPRRCAKAL